MKINREPTEEEELAVLQRALDRHRKRPRQGLGSAEAVNEVPSGGEGRARSREESTV